MTATQKKIADMAPKVIPYLSDETANQVYSIFMTVDIPEEKDVSYRIGAAEGEFKAPEDFDANNEEVYAWAERYTLS